MKFSTMLTPSSVHLTIFKDTTMGPMIPKEMKYNLHYGEVRGDVLPPPYGTSIRCSVSVKNIDVQKTDLGNKEHTTD